MPDHRGRFETPSPQQFTLQCSCHDLITHSSDDRLAAAVLDGPRGVRRLPLPAKTGGVAALRWLSLRGASGVRREAAATDTGLSAMPPALVPHLWFEK